MKLAFTLPVRMTWRELKFHALENWLELRIWNGNDAQPKIFWRTFPAWYYTGDPSSTDVPRTDVLEGRKAIVVVDEVNRRYQKSYYPDRQSVYEEVRDSMRELQVDFSAIGKQPPADWGEEAKKRKSKDTVIRKRLPQIDIAAFDLMNPVFATIPFAADLEGGILASFAITLTVTIQAVTR